jgi:hypothetical protein
VLDLIDRAAKCLMSRRCGGRSNAADAAVSGALLSAVRQRRVGVAEATRMHDHLVDTVLRDAGIIDYASNIAAEPLIAVPL